MSTVKLLQDLPQFNAPDTSTTRMGTLLQGSYAVTDVEMRGTDQYVQVSTWICSQSNGVVYAQVTEDPEPVTQGVSESFLVAMLQKFQGFVYSISYPKYTSPIPNVPGLPLMPPKQNSCCIFVEDLVVHGFQLAYWSFVWDQHRHDQMMVADWNNKYSPPFAPAEAGLARPAVGPSSSLGLPQPWSVCQGWGQAGGHTFIVLAVHSATGKVLILESSSTYGFSGPGLRGLGDLDAYLASGPPADWWTLPSVPTWNQIKSNYSYGIALAQLKVLTTTLVWGRSS
jgi:hypothetical protein